MVDLTEHVNVRGGSVRACIHGGSVVVCVLGPSMVGLSMPPSSVVVCVHARTFMVAHGPSMDHGGSEHASIRSVVTRTFGPYGGSENVNVRGGGVRARACSNIHGGSEYISDGVRARTIHAWA